MKEEGHSKKMEGENTLDSLVTELKRREADVKRNREELVFFKHKVAEQRDAIHNYICTTVPQVWINLVDTPDGEIQLPGYFTAEAHAMLEFAGKCQMVGEDYVRERWLRVRQDQIETRSVALEELVRGLPYEPYVSLKKSLLP